MTNSIQGFSLCDADKKEDLQQIFKHILTPKDHFPHRFIISKEETNNLPISSSVFDASTLNLVAVSHKYKETSVDSILFNSIKFFGSGYYVYNKKLFLDPLTNTIIKVNKSEQAGFYEKCEFINIANQIDSNVAINIHADADTCLNSNNVHILPFCRRSFNFSHWHLNTLSSIYLARKHTPDAMIVLPKLVNWQRESLISLDLYDKDKIIEVPLLQSCIVPNAMFFSPMFTWKGIGNTKPMISMFKDAKFFRDCPAQIQKKWAKLPSKIYLSRRSDPAHKLINEHLVEEEFASRGFLILEPQSISYHELAYLVAHVDILAGQSGSALIRAGMCKPDATFIQLAYEGFPTYWLHKVAALTGCSQSYIYVEPRQSIITNPEITEANHFYKIGGWSVNIDNFKAFLRNIF